MRTQHVVVKEYDPVWENRYQQEGEVKVFSRQDMNILGDSEFRGADIYYVKNNIWKSRKLHIRFFLCLL